MEDTKGVAAKGGVGVAMFDGGPLLRLMALGPLLWGWLNRGVEAPHRGWQVPEEGRGVEGLVAVSLVCGGGSQGGGCVLSRVVAPFMCLTGF